MQISQLDARTFVGPQISVADLPALADLGVKSIIVARPENETDDQPAIATLAAVASDLGIQITQIPVIPGQITDSDIQAYETCVCDNDDPVFAYCRSGMRATTLWALNAAKDGKPAQDILHAAKAINFDLSGIAHRLSERA